MGHQNRSKSKKCPILQIYFASPQYLMKLVNWQNLLLRKAIWVKLIECIKYDLLTLKANLGKSYLLVRICAPTAFYIDTQNFEETKKVGLIEKLELQPLKSSRRADITVGLVFPKWASVDTLWSTVYGCCFLFMLYSWWFYSSGKFSIKNPVHGLEKALGSVHSLNGIQPLSDEYLYSYNYIDYEHLYQAFYCLETYLSTYLVFIIAQDEMKKYKFMVSEQEVVNISKAIEPSVQSFANDEL